MSETPSSADVINLEAYRELGLIGPESIEDIGEGQDAEVTNLAEWREARNKVVDVRPALIATVLTQRALEVSREAPVSSGFGAEEIRHMAIRSGFRELANRYNASG